MLAKEYNPKKVVFPVAVEDKLDGIRIYFRDGQGFTRNGKTYETLKPIAEIIQSVCKECDIPNYTLDAEVMGRNWNETPHLVKRKHDIDDKAIRKHLTINLFDIFSTDETDLIWNQSYTARRKLLALITKAIKQDYPSTYRFRMMKSVIASNEAELQELLKDALSRKKEGIMIKALDAPYECKRSYSWMKLKPFKDITVTITGYECAEGLCPECSMKKSIGKKEGCSVCNGTGEIEKPNLLGTFICDYEGEEVRVGSGISAKEREEWWAIRAKLIGKKIDVKVQDEDNGNNILARFPTFMRLRSDLD